MPQGDLPSIYVSLDLETTGLDSDQDSIIEIGAVKFQRGRVLETYQTLVNPYRQIPPFVQRLTGIPQSSVDRAVPFAAVAVELQEFIGALPIVGHNISFDLKFLASHGMSLGNESYDTWDLVSILMPYCRSYSLLNLAQELGAVHSRPHRALSDAQATQMVFDSLLERAPGVDPAVLAYIHSMATRARWPVGQLLGAPPQADGGTSALGLTGVDISGLGKRLATGGRSLKPELSVDPVDAEAMDRYLAPGGLVPQAFPGFEQRPEQLEMARAVADAINDAKHLIVEAGTGVGKSLAYLLPAVLHSIRNGTRVVVSTNTINLQEQLLQKDIPVLVDILESNGVIPEGSFKVVPLKGRANYLCLRRWSHMARAEALNGDEVRLLGKTLVWLQDTSNGDRAEINLAGRDATTWSRVSASEQGRCPGMRGEGPCFLRTARDRAEGAHMIVVNHALLLSDLAMGGAILPDYQYLIIDEAHRLEEGATRQLSFQVSQTQLNDELESIERQLTEVRVLLRSPALSGFQQQRGQELVTELDSRWSRKIKETWGRLWDMVENFISVPGTEGGDQSQMRITRTTRTQPGWSDVEIAWENVDLSLGDGATQIDRLCRLIEDLPQDAFAEMDTPLMELATRQEAIEAIRERLKVLLVSGAEETRIDWISRNDDGRGGSSSGRRPSIVLNSAPLNVGPELDGGLFSQKSSVILTSATLSTQGSFDYVRERVGLADAGELHLGSPFDYANAALLLIPEDIPMPDAWGYQQAMEKLLVDLGKSLEGHVLALFTSHAALRGTARAVRGPLEAEDIRVLAQGMDGSPARILADFADDPKGVILGTSSFWEGVDLSGGLLKAVVVARLPFQVPTEPIFAARSEQYEDSFKQYAIPQSVLRFRQGIGRLIRGSTDKGSIVVLDRRITARSYGKSFLDSIPPATVKVAPITAIPELAAHWAGRRGQAESGGRRAP